jgi:hypothetical protein
MAMEIIQGSVTGCDPGSLSTPLPLRWARCGRRSRSDGVWMENGLCIKYRKMFRKAGSEEMREPRVADQPCVILTRPVKP